MFLCMSCVCFIYLCFVFVCGFIGYKMDGVLIGLWRF